MVLQEQEEEEEEEEVKLVIINEHLRVAPEMDASCRCLHGRRYGNARRSQDLELDRRERGRRLVRST